MVRVICVSVPEKNLGPVSAAASFVTTHWSVVLRAGNQHSPESASSLEKLCCVYWHPLYGYVRRQGKNPHDAQDLTQEFFSCLLASHSLGAVHPSKGRFRSFLIAALNHFLANDWKQARRQKRGGDHTHFSLDAATAEDRFQHELPDHFTPDKAFERRWAETLLQTVLDRLRAEWEPDGAPRHFDEMKAFLIEGKDAATFAEVAGRLGVTEASLKWSVHKLRGRYGEIFREEIASTVSHPDEVEDEIRHLFAVMAG